MPATQSNPWLTPPALSGTVPASLAARITVTFLQDMALLRKLQCSGGTSDMAECGTAQQASDTGRQLRNRWTSAQVTARCNLVN